MNALQDEIGVWLRGLSTDYCNPSFLIQREHVWLDRRIGHQISQGTQWTNHKRRSCPQFCYICHRYHLRRLFDHRSLDIGFLHIEHANTHVGMQATNAKHTQVGPKLPESLDDGNPDHRLGLFFDSPSQDLDLNFWIRDEYSCYWYAIGDDRRP